MTTIEASCPKCHVKDLYGEELIGRYTFCQHCHCRFYIEVPGLGASPTNGVIRESHHPSRASDQHTTLDDVLWDTQKGSRVVIRSLARLEQRLQQIYYGVVVLAILSLVSVVLTALR
jgi:hypothetical protein